MKKVLIHLAAALYAGGAIFTFGQVYNRASCPTGAISDPCPDYKAASALLAGAFWPLALSAIAQEGDAK